MKTALGLFLLVAMASDCCGQFQVQINTEPLVANEKGEIVPLSQATNLSAFNPKAETVEVMSLDAAHSQLREIYRYCPGLVSAFEKMRSAPQLRMHELEGFDRFNKLLDEA